MAPGGRNTNADKIAGKAQSSFSWGHVTVIERVKLLEDSLNVFGMQTIKKHIVITTTNKQTFPNSNRYHFQIGLHRNHSESKVPSQLN